MPVACRSSAPSVESDVLYLGYVDRRDDLDLYGFDATPLAQVGVRLSHLAGDGDLVVYGPATETPANSPSPVETRTIVPSTPPLASDDLDVSGAGFTPEPDVDAAVPVIDGLTVVGRSAARDTDLEAVDAIAPDLLQVSAYNDAVSNQPYVLRVRQVDPPSVPACVAYAGTGGVAGSMPDLTALPADLATVFLVNQQRLGDRFGAAEAASTIDAARSVRRASRGRGRRDPGRGARRRSPLRTPTGTPTRAWPTAPTRSSTRSPASWSGCATAPSTASPRTWIWRTSSSSAETTSCRWPGSTTPPGSATRRATPTSSTSTGRTTGR